jgi:chromosome segregation ATPase
MKQIILRVNAYINKIPGECKMPCSKNTVFLSLLALLWFPSYSFTITDQAFYLMTQQELQQSQTISADNQLELQNLKANLQQVQSQSENLNQNLTSMTAFSLQQEEQINSLQVNCLELSQIATESAIQLQASQESVQALKKTTEELTTSFQLYKEGVQSQYRQYESALRNKELEKWLYTGAGAILTGIVVHFITSGFK